MTRWEQVKKELLNCPAYDLIGLKAEEEGDRLVAVLEVGEQHLNYARISMGMFAYALADAVGRWEISRLMPNERPVTGTINDAVFLKTAKKGDILKAEAEIINQEGRKIFVRAAVFNQDRKAVARFGEIIYVLMKEGGEKNGS